MKTPVLLLVGALALWGQASGHWLAAGLLALVVLLPAAFKLKFDLEDRDLTRAADLSSLLAAGTLVYFLATRSAAQGLFAFAIWLPASLIPILLASLLSRQPLRRRHLFYTLRHSTRPLAQRETDLVPLYFAATLLAAGTVAPTSSPGFFPALCALLLFWLFINLPGAHHRLALPFALFALFAAGSGWIGASALRLTHQSLQEWFVEQMSGDNDDPYRSQTRIGDLGQIKLSDRIVWRVALPPSTPLPLRLRDGVFTHFDGQVWTARRDSFRSFPANSSVSGQSLEISGSAHKQQALLALPQNTRAIHGLPAQIEHNGYGIVRIKEAPGWLRFRVVYSTSASGTESPPHAREHTVDLYHSRLFARIPAIEALARQNDRDKLRGIEAFFSGRFRYTLALGREAEKKRDLERFLLHDQAGHCEYFATATVLLLRHLGIPARYVTGYSVQEYSPLEKRFVVRQRHAHAWAEAWIDGRWQEIDTTPSEWLTVEEQTASWWQPAADLCSWLWMRFSEWRQQEGHHGASSLWLLPLFAAALVLGWRLWRRRWRQTAPASPVASVDDAIATRLQALEREFAAQGYGRPPAEPPRHWLQRVAQESGEQLGAERLEAARNVVAEHYRQRYSGHEPE